jgi:hypothetical protein
MPEFIQKRANDTTSIVIFIVIAIVIIWYFIKALTLVGDYTSSDGKTITVKKDSNGNYMLVDSTGAAYPISIWKFFNQQVNGKTFSTYFKTVTYDGVTYNPVSTTTTTTTN